MKELGGSLREERRDIEYARTVTLSFLINERKKRFRGRVSARAEAFTKKPSKRSPPRKA